MPFDKAFDDLYRLGIRAACADANALCSRVDEQVFTTLVIERIYQEIVAADIVIADLTGRNPNVFYEVGFAHALQKPVVLLAKDTGDIPFDLRMHRHIVYGESISTAKELLTRDLRELLELKEDRLFGLANVEFHVLQPQFDKKYTIENFISLEGGRAVALTDGIVLQVPGELSSHGRGFYFDFALAASNPGNRAIVLEGTKAEIRFPADVHLADESLKEGIGKNTLLANDGTLNVTIDLSDIFLPPKQAAQKHLHLRSTATRELDGKKIYRTSFGIRVILRRHNETWEKNIAVEIAPWRRLN